jgi:Uma2 family endonuclease
MTSKIEHLMTVDDLEAFPDDDGNRYEVIEGELFVSCSPSLTHQVVSTNLIYVIRSYLEKHPIGIVVTTIGLILSKISGVIPDLVFFKHESAKSIVTGERLTSAPEIVIEIISLGSENIRRDRVAKFRLYEKYGVAEYWLIDLEKQTVEIYRLLEGKLQLAATISGSDELTTPILPGFSCSASEVFALPPLFNQ